MKNEPETPDNEELSPAERRREKGLRVEIDAGSPSVKSVARVVVVALVILFFAGYLQAIISAIYPLLFLIVLSVFFAYLIDPLVKLVRAPFKLHSLERFMPRSLAIVLAYAMVFAVLGISIASVAPTVAEQGKEFGTNIPVYAQALRTRINDMNRRFDRLRVPDEVQTEVNRKVTDIGSSVTESVGNSVIVLVTYLPWFVLIPILAFFFLKDVNMFRLGVLRVFPAGRWRYRAEQVMADVNTTLAAYTRAQLISCFIIAIICTAGFYLIGMKYALLLGILAGIFEFVPLLGPLAIALIVVTTTAGGDDPWRALYSAIFLIVLRIVHDYFTYPRIVRGGIHMHPLAIILSVLAGEQVAGIPGVFLSIPLVAIGSVIYKHILEHQGRRGLVSEWIEHADNEVKGEII